MTPSDNVMHDKLVLIVGKVFLQSMSFVNYKHTDVLCTCSYWYDERFVKIVYMFCKNSHHIAENATRKITTIIKLILISY